MTSRASGSPKVFIVDFLVALCCFFLIIALLESPSKPTVPTYGVMAITTTWQTLDDVDLYVRNPDGQTVYFAAPSTALMYLEHDTIPLSTDVSGSHRTVVKGEHERVVITGVIPGEYTVNVQMYNKVVSKPCVVLVQVWSLRGQDRVLLSQTVVLRHSGDERTAFRVTLDANGRIASISHVQTSLVGGAPPPQVSDSGGFGP